MKLKNPKVSVIIPVYNGEKTLFGCLQSIINQTYKNYEVIVVNNNSTDKTKSIIREFKKKNNKIFSVFEPFRSRGAARNKGILKASGEIIAMIDVDCIAPRNWIDELIKPIIEEGEDIVVGFEDDLIKNFWTSNRQKNDWELVKRLAKGKYVNHIDTKNFAIRASLMKKILFNQEIGNLEDYELYLRLKNICKIRFLPEIRVGHYHKSSLLGMALIQFDRGFWVRRIYDLHKKDKNILKDPMFEKIPYENMIKGPKNMYNLLLHNRNKETFFKLVEEIFWRAGILWAAFSSKY